MSNICIGITKKGVNCTRKVQNGKQYCYNHDPDKLSTDRTGKTYCSNCSVFRLNKLFVDEYGNNYCTCKLCRGKESNKVRIRNRDKGLQRQYEKNHKLKKIAEIGDDEYKRQKNEYMKEYRRRKKEEKLKQIKNTQNVEPEIKETPYQRKKRRFVEKYGIDAWRKKETDRKKRQLEKKKKISQN